MTSENLRRVFLSLKNTCGRNMQELHLECGLWTRLKREAAKYYTLCYWNPRPPTLCWEQRILGVVGQNTGESDRPLLWVSRSVGFLIWSQGKDLCTCCCSVFFKAVKPSIRWTWLRCESHERSVLMLRLPSTRSVIQLRCVWLCLL